MPKFYLHIRDGDKFFEDYDGVDLPDLDTARNEVINAARDILAERLRAGEILDGQVFEIWDDTGMLAVVPFQDAVRRQ